MYQMAGGAGSEAEAVLFRGQEDSALAPSSNAVEIQYSTDRIMSIRSGVLRALCAHGH